MSLETPIKIRMLQRKPYQKAKEEPDYRFYLLYDKIYREDILNHAYALAKSNQGAPGVHLPGLPRSGTERIATRLPPGSNRHVSMSMFCHRKPTQHKAADRPLIGAQEEKG